MHVQDEALPSESGDELSFWPKQSFRVVNLDYNSYKNHFIRLEIEFCIEWALPCMCWLPLATRNTGRNEPLRGKHDRYHFDQSKHRATESWNTSIERPWKVAWGIAAWLQCHASAVRWKASYVAESLLATARSCRPIKQAPLSRGLVSTRCSKESVLWVHGFRPWMTIGVV